MSADALPQRAETPADLVLRLCKLGATQQAIAEAFACCVEEIETIPLSQILEARKALKARWPSVRRRALSILAARHGVSSDHTNTPRAETRDEACPYCPHAPHTGQCGVSDCWCWLPESSENVPPSAATRRPPQNQRSEKIDRLLRLIALLPVGLRADWEGTNHYELTASGDEKFWWLELGEIADADLHSESETGRRVGLLLDIAEAAKAAEWDLLLTLSSLLPTTLRVEVKAMRRAAATNPPSPPP